jgi:hypothetical protein
VVVEKTGRLTGAVFGRGFIVEKGGEFFGELSIGKVEMTQGELLEAPSKKSSGSKKGDSGSDFTLVSS